MFSYSNVTEADYYNITQVGRGTTYRRRAVIRLGYFIDKVNYIDNRRFQLYNYKMPISVNIVNNG